METSGMTLNLFLSFSCVLPLWALTSPYFFGFSLPTEWVKISFYFPPPRNGSNQEKEIHEMPTVTERNVLLYSLVFAA
jgi:hypothetical protein